MRHRVTLPTELGSNFSLRQAQDAGIGVDRCDVADLHRPFPGVRSIRPPVSFVDTVRAYAPRMKDGHRLCGRTAARLWGLPLPQMWTSSEPLEVCVPLDAAPPKVAGVVGRRLGTDRARTWKYATALLVDPVAALFTCAASLTVAQFVMMIDALITTADNYPGYKGRRPLSTVESIELRLGEWGKFPGCGKVRAALVRARPRVESPKETETRLLIVDAGLPEPQLQVVVRDRGRFIARVDMAYPEWKIAIEYDGDGHRQERHQWRVGVRRRRELEALGWTVIPLTQDDLSDGGAGFLPRLRTLLSRPAGA